MTKTAKPLKTFRFYSDPGHGWLAVKVTDLAKVGLTEDKISGYSYKKGGTLYLEEDCDASLFVDAWKAKFGSFSHKSIYHEKTPIRSYGRVGY